MKLKTKLIPLAGAAAVCATVAPITLTACGSTSVGKTIDLKDGYNPSGVQHKYEVLTCQQMLSDYAEAIDDNKDVFAQDFLWSKARYLELLPQALLHYSNGMNETQIVLLSAECKINNLKVETPQKLIATIDSITTPKPEEYSIPTLSIDYEYHFEFEGPRLEGDVLLPGQSSKAIYAATAHMVFKNIPYVTQTLRSYDSQTIEEAFPTCWCFTPLYHWMLSSVIQQQGITFETYPKAWSISYDYEMDTTTTETSGTTEIEIVDVFKKEGNILSTSLRQLSETDKRICEMLILPDMIPFVKPMNKGSKINYIGLVGASAYSWYGQSVGVDSADAPFWENTINN